MDDKTFNELIKSGELSLILMDGGADLTPRQMAKVKGVAKDLSDKRLEEMAAELAASPGFQEMMMMPLMSELMKINKNKQKKSTSTNKEVRDTDQQTSAPKEKLVSKKDPNFTTTVPDSDNPLRMGDSSSDILGKIYNLLFRKREHDEEIEKYETDQSHKELDRKIKQNQELIDLFQVLPKTKTGPKLSKGKPSKKKTGKKKTKEAKETEPAGEKPKPTTTTKTKEPTTPTPSLMDKALSIFKPTAVGTVLGVGGISAAAALSIKRETGKSANEAITAVGQVVANDPEPGYYSYGVFGMNSKAKTVDSFIKQFPSLGFKEKPGTPAFNDEWKAIAKDKPKEMLDAQLAWYDNNITKPLKKDLNVQLPANIAEDERVVTYVSDRRIQYGKLMEGSAFKYASNSNSPEEFINKVTEFDLQNIDTAFATYLRSHPNNRPGLVTRIQKRREESLSVTPTLASTKDSTNKTNVTTQPVPPPTVNIPQKEKAPTSSSKPVNVSVLNNNTNVYNTSPTYSVADDNTSNKPALVNKQYQAA